MSVFKKLEQYTEEGLALLRRIVRSLEEIKKLLEKERGK